jgi:hypothetical protein
MATQQLKNSRTNSTTALTRKARVNSPGAIRKTLSEPGLRKCEYPPMVNGRAKKKAATHLFWENVPIIRSPQPQESDSRGSQKAALALASKRTQARLEVQDAKRPLRHAPGQTASRTNIISSSRVPRLQLRSRSEIHHECKEPLARNPQRQCAANPRARSPEQPNRFAVIKPFASSVILMAGVQICFLGRRSNRLRKGKG